MPSFTLPHIALPHIAFPHFVVLGNILATYFPFFAIFFLFLISYSVVRIFEIGRRRKNFCSMSSPSMPTTTPRRPRRPRGAHARKIPAGTRSSTMSFLRRPRTGRSPLSRLIPCSKICFIRWASRAKRSATSSREADRETFPHLTAAWEAHAVRNRVAHEGTAVPSLRSRGQAGDGPVRGHFQGFSGIYSLIWLAFLPNMSRIGKA